jgi:hypothetical protein
MHAWTWRPMLCGGLPGPGGGARTREGMSALPVVVRARWVRCTSNMVVRTTRQVC